MLSPAEPDAMGARGRAAFETKYNWKAMEPRLLDSYPDLLDTTSSPDRDRL